MGNYRPLTKSELTWSTNLKSIFEQKKQAEGINQEALGERIGISAGAVSQYLNGKIAMSLSAKVAFSIALGCDVKDIDPDIPYQPPLADDEAQLIQNYRRANQKGKRLILEVAAVSPAYQIMPSSTVKNRVSAPARKSGKPK